MSELDRVQEKYRGVQRLLVEKNKKIQKLKEKLMKAKSIIYRSTPCDVDDNGNHVDDCERCAFLRGVRGY